MRAGDHKGSPLQEAFPFYSGHHEGSPLEKDSTHLHKFSQLSSFLVLRTCKQATGRTRVFAAVF